MQRHEFTRFTHYAMENFKQRVIEALGETSRAVQMEIAHQEATTMTVHLKNVWTHKRLWGLVYVTVAYKAHLASN